MSVINTQPLIGASGNQVTGYNIERSLRFRSSASAGLSRTPSSTGDRQKFTWSGWVKRGALSSSTTYTLFDAQADANNWFSFWFRNDTLSYDTAWTSVANRIITKSTAVYRDPSAYYHIILAVDTTQATAVNRIRLYVNNSEVTSFSYDVGSGYVAQNTNLSINTASLLHSIGRRNGGTPDNFFDGYLTDINFIDGQQLTPSSFGESDATTGVWKPKRYTGTYGTNGFYLKFTDVATTSGSNAGLGKDFSGNGNYWNTNNISVTSGSTYDSMTDVPTLSNATAANYAVLSPLTYSTTGYTLSDGNLKAVGTASATYGWNAYGTMAFPITGKYYFEVTSISNGFSGMVVGISPTNSLSWGGSTGNSSNGYGYYSNDGTKQITGTGSSYGATWTTGDVIGIAFDADAGTLTFYKNNTSQGVAASGLTSTYLPWIRSTSDPTLSQVSSCAVNFGQRPFAYTPPTGYKALNTYNLPDSTIVAGNEYMDATTWTGDGNTSRTITTASNFKPDLVWIKQRSIDISHTVYDTIRGASTGSTSKSLVTNATVAEGSNNDNSTYGYLDSFTSTGFTTVRGSNGTTSYTNANGGTYVAWQWQAGQGTTSSNTNGSITSTVSVNPSAGFSVVTYTGNGTAGATFGHGLGVTPAFVMIKKRSASGDWQVYHQSIGNTGAIFPNLTIGTYTTNLAWNNTSPTSSVVSLGSGADVNGNGQTFVAYCWSEIAGFSKFSSYVGNGSADGTFVYLGFRPKFIMVKRTDASTNWWMMDTSRNTYNVMGLELYPNLANSEAQWTGSDFLSNGIKFRTTDVAYNVNGANYVYMAFAENPFRNSLAR